MRGAQRVLDRRWLHPAAWWVWAGALGAAALRTTNPLLLGLIGAVVAVVVAHRRPEAGWSRSFAAFVRLGVVVIVIRVGFQILFGVRTAGTVLFTLPSVGLPAWAAGVSIGGPVTAESLLLAFRQGLRLAVVLACFGAAGSLASPYRLLRCLPGVLYEAGVAVTVAVSFAPQVVLAAGRVREARRLRGRPVRGPRSWRGTALPVLEGALERSVALAASMDARGYGRRRELPGTVRRLTTGATLVGLVAAAVGVYALLDASAPRGLGFPALALGSLALAIALFAGGRRTPRTRHRPDPWRGPEWATVAAGVVVLAGFVAAARAGVVLDPPMDPLGWPDLPALPALVTLVGVLPAVVTPLPPAAAPGPARADRASPAGPVPSGAVA